mmetsp:Transcript_33671/g.72832  ORF Transcript_33671/g.72832 Transcript_33671/m.72832 type:complete len:221 (-) Transcript_33671:843-1505(-)
MPSSFLLASSIRSLVPSRLSLRSEEILCRDVDAQHGEDGSGGHEGVVEGAAGQAGRVGVVEDVQKRRQDEREHGGGARSDEADHESEVVAHGDGEGPREQSEDQAAVVWAGGAGGLAQNALRDDLRGRAELQGVGQKHSRAQKDVDGRHPCVRGHSFSVKLRGDAAVRDLAKGEVAHRPDQPENGAGRDDPGEKDFPELFRRPHGISNGQDQANALQRVH